MQIVVKRGALELATGASWTDGVLTRGLPIDVRRLMETVNTLGAAGISVFDRTTRSVSLEFTITRTHADEAQALIFAGTHDAIATGKADLRFVFELNDVTYTLRSLGCAWEAVTTNPEGVSTDTDYRVSGPPFAALADSGVAVGPRIHGGAIAWFIAGNAGLQEYGLGVLYGGRIGSQGLPVAAIASNVPIATFIP